MKRIRNESDKPPVKKILLRYLNCIQTINMYTKNMNKNQFKKDMKTVQAVQMNINLISQATSSLKMSFRKENKDIKWNYIIELRNDLIHEYYNTGKNLTWDFIKDNLPQLEKKCIDTLIQEYQFDMETFHSKGLQEEYLPYLEKKAVEMNKRLDIFIKDDISRG